MRKPSAWRPTKLCEDCGQLVTLLVNLQTKKSVPVLTKRWDGVTVWYTRSLSNILHTCRVRTERTLRDKMAVPSEFRL